MEIAFGHMRVTPATFWGYSLIEWLAALEGYRIKMGGEKTEPFTSSDLSRLMERYPDDRNPS